MKKYIAIRAGCGIFALVLLYVAVEIMCYGIDIESFAWYMCGGLLGLLSCCFGSVVFLPRR